MTYEQFIRVNPTPDAPTQTLVAKAWKAATDAAIEVAVEVMTDYDNLTQKDFHLKYKTLDLAGALRGRLWEE